MRSEINAPTELHADGTRRIRDLTNMAASLAVGFTSVESFRRRCLLLLLLAPWILLSFVYVSFVRTFKRRLEKIRCDLLLKDFTPHRVANAMESIAALRKFHAFVDDAVSVSAFLAYVLTFGNILLVVGIFTTDTLQDLQTSHIVFSVNVFVWTLAWFLILTMCGSKVACIAPLTKDLIEELASRCLRKAAMRRQETVSLVLLNECTKNEMFFTGWGLFTIDKSLLLTTSGVFVTYGVLYATELGRKF